MTRPSTIRRKNMRIDQAKLDRAKEILGTKTETETVEAALDLVSFRREVYAGLDRIGGSNSIRDLDELDDAAEDAA